MSKTAQLIQLMRPQQWYKNLVVYLALMFTVQLFLPYKLVLVTLGLAALCLISSANYALNDIIDRKKDRLNPEKRKRPLASGNVRVWEAFALTAILLAAGLGIAWSLETPFFLATTVLFIFTQAYSLVLKRILFVDVLSISVNFVIRAVAGALIISVTISPWLILCTFFLSLFIAAGKRASEAKFLGPKGKRHRSVLEGYTKETTNMLIMITTTLLIISYSLYSFLSNHSWLLITLPFALYTILRYNFLIHTGSAIGRRPELALKDVQMMAGAGIWTLAALLVLYLS
ncbi:decaprenyl-phosphate phosphoribosyltransferase [Candidatus Woesearchaeota archaeon]|nr:decaprenyl-phosphate phosphoribosyltransferase [Candidatus Woesearchaeota archaeon]